MDLRDAHVGALVEVTNFTSAQGILAGPKDIKNRRHDARGIVVSVQPKAGTFRGVVWVRHGGVIAPYWGSELRLLGIKDPEG